MALSLRICLGLARNFGGGVGLWPHRSVSVNGHPPDTGADAESTWPVVNLSASGVAPVSSFQLISSWPVSAINATGIAPSSNAARVWPTASIGISAVPPTVGRDFSVSWPIGGVDIVGNSPLAVQSVNSGWPSAAANIGAIGPSTGQNYVVTWPAGSAEVTASVPVTDVDSAGGSASLADVQSIVNGTTGGFILISDAGLFQDTGAVTSSGLGDHVRLWQDQSTNGYDFIGSSDADSPVVVADGLSHGALTNIKVTGLPTSGVTAQTIFMRFKTTDTATMLAVGNFSSRYIGYGKGGDSNTVVDSGSGTSLTYYVDESSVTATRGDLSDAWATGSFVNVEVRDVDLTIWGGQFRLLNHGAISTIGTLDAVIVVPESVAATSTNRADIYSYLNSR